MAFPGYILVILSFVVAFVIVFSSIPTIVFVSKAKKLCDEPNSRKLHEKSVPNLGGVAIFAAVLIVSGLFLDLSKHKEFQYLLVGAIILFFAGMKDDILILDPFKKLYSQIIAALIIIILGDLRYTNLHGFLGISHIPYVASILLSLFVFIVIINGFNLIDGIDGLASGVGIISTLVFGSWFLLVGEFQYAIISFALIGAAVAFFWFNVFSKKNKIFMGDTGSLLLGLFLAVLAVKFNEMNIVPTSKWFIHSSPAVSFGILIIPLFDTIRVFIIRLFKGKSPFKADTNHVHHKLLAMGLSHLKSTLYILGINVVLIINVLLLNRKGVVDLMIMNFALATLFSILPEYIFKRKEKKLLSGKP